VIVFEASKPDVSLGYEVASALHFGKPVIVLYRANTGAVPTV